MRIEYIFLREARELLKDMRRVGIIRIGELTQLKDGSISPIYIDMRDRLTDDHPELLPWIGKLFAGKLIDIAKQSKTSLKQVVIGVPDSAHPLAVAITIMGGMNRTGVLEPNISCLIQRKIPKLHGINDQKGKFIIGKPKANREYNLVDDVITTSKSKRESIAIMQKEGFPVKRIIVFFDREQGGGKSLIKDGYKFYSIFKLTKVTQFFFDEKLISEKQYKDTLEFITDHQVE